MRLSVPSLFIGRFQAQHSEQGHLARFALQLREESTPIGLHQLSGERSHLSSHQNRHSRIIPKSMPWRLWPLKRKRYRFDS
jgi:hypothetical protein